MAEIEFKFYQDAVEGYLEKIFLEEMQLLNNAFKEAITSDVWNWNDGQLRDIVDTGELRDSQEIQIEKLKVRFTWVWYAAIVINGYSRGDINYPGRDFITYALLTLKPFKTIKINQSAIIKSRYL